MQQRLVRCQDHLGQTMPDLKCPLSSRPANSRMCNRSQCNHFPIRGPKYLWKRSPWTECSQSCGRGTSSRNVQCVNISNGGKVVSDGFCLTKTASLRSKRTSKSQRKMRRGKPKTLKRCNKIPCPFTWRAQQWSEVRFLNFRAIESFLFECSLSFLPF